MRFHGGAMSMGTRGLLLVMLTGFVALVVANLQKRRYIQQTSDGEDDLEGLDVDAGPSWKELYKEAQRLDISGRSRMSKDELEAAVRRLG